MNREELTNFINNNTLNHPFLISIKEQLERKGSLSDKQWEAVEKFAVPKSKPVLVKESTPELKKWENPTFSEGSVLLLSRKGARLVGEELNNELSFRQIEVIETFRETEKAIQVKIKYSPKVTSYCCQCGRHLTHPVSVLAGIGPECAGRFGVSKKQYEDANEVIKAKEETLKNAGECIIWLPRFTIKEVV